MALLHDDLMHTLRFVCPRAGYYLPAGLEPIDTSLRTTAPDIRRREIEQQRRAYQTSRT